MDLWNSLECFSHPVKLQLISSAWGTKSWWWIKLQQVWGMPFSYVNHLCPEFSNTRDYWPGTQRSETYCLTMVAFGIQFPERCCVKNASNKRWKAGGFQGEVRPGERTSLSFPRRSYTDADIIFSSSWSYLLRVKTLPQLLSIWALP